MSPTQPSTVPRSGLHPSWCAPRHACERVPSLLEPREHEGMPGSFYLDWIAARVEARLRHAESVDAAGAGDRGEVMLDLTLVNLESVVEPFQLSLTVDDLQVLLHQLNRYARAMKRSGWFDAETVKEATR